MQPDEVLQVMDACGVDTTGAVVTPLTGGVSCDTYAVDASGESWVVKQALGALRVSELWESDPGRVVAEAEALRWFHGLSPDHVPEPLAVIESFNAVVLPRATQPSPDLRQVLLEDPTAISPALGAGIGALLARWHQSDSSEAKGTVLDEYSRLISLRVDPFYRNMATKWTEYAGLIVEAANELLETSHAVIHGDFTPKNLLVLGDGFWVIDTETAHIGHPVLDTASMLAHLLLKEIHHREDEPKTQAVREFRVAFDEALSGSPMSRPDSLGIHIGTIMGVRVDGRSRVSYLSENARTSARTVARSLLEGATVDEAMGA